LLYLSLALSRYSNINTDLAGALWQELENPRTYIMSTIIRSHPQTVFEELQLLGRVPGSDIWSSRCVRHEGSIPPAKHFPLMDGRGPHLMLL
jgi:hypothetical protein